MYGQAGKYSVDLKVHAPHQGATLDVYTIKEKADGTKEILVRQTIYHD